MNPVAAPAPERDAHCAAHHRPSAMSTSIRAAMMRSAGRYSSRSRSNRKSHRSSAFDEGVRPTQEFELAQKGFTRRRGDAERTRTNQMARECTHYPFSSVFRVEAFLRVSACPPLSRKRPNRVRHSVHFRTNVGCRPRPGGRSGYVAMTGGGRSCQPVRRCRRRWRAQSHPCDPRADASGRSPMICRQSR